MLNSWLVVKITPNGRRLVQLPILKNKFVEQHKTKLNEQRIEYHRPGN
jgi:hypothetical protein